MPPNGRNLNHVLVLAQLGDIGIGDEVSLISFVALRTHLQGKLLGPLDGIPYAAKDNFCTLGVPTTASSAALAEFTPPYDSTPTGRLRLAGSPLLGKTNMDEFGMGSGTLFSEHGQTLNPWSPGTPSKMRSVIPRGGLDFLLPSSLHVR